MLTAYFNVLRITNIRGLVILQNYGLYRLKTNKFIAYVTNCKSRNVFILSRTDAANSNSKF